MACSAALGKSGEQQAVLMVAVAAGAVAMMVEAAVVQMVTAIKIVIVMRESS